MATARQQICETTEAQKQRQQQQQQQHHTTTKTAIASSATRTGRRGLCRLVVQLRQPGVRQRLLHADAPPRVKLQSRGGAHQARVQCWQRTGALLEAAAAAVNNLSFAA